jgi:hypothetical protein
MNTEHTEIQNAAQAPVAGEEVPAFGHTWDCSNCGHTNHGYKLLCEKCDEW